MIIHSNLAQKGYFYPLRLFDKKKWIILFFSGSHFEIDTFLFAFFSFVGGKRKYFCYEKNTAKEKLFQMFVFFFFCLLLMMMKCLINDVSVFETQASNFISGRNSLNKSLSLFAVCTSGRWRETFHCQFLSFSTKRKYFWQWCYDHFEDYVYLHWHHCQLNHERLYVKVSKSI